MSFFKKDDKLHQDVVHIYEKIDRLSDKLDRRLEKTDNRIDNIDKSLAVYNEQLKVHIEGVEQARLENKQLREYIDMENTKLAHKIQPIAAHVMLMKNGFKVVMFIAGAIAGVAGLVAIMLEILK